MAAISTRIMDYLGGLVLVGGDHDGQAFTVLPWERRFIRGAFAQSGPAALSVARGNGKSAVVAGIAAAVVDPDGPLHGRRREAVVVASSLGQARIVFEDVLAFMGERYDIGKRTEWRKQDSQFSAVLEHRDSGARVRCIGSDPARAHGLRPALALMDEPAQWPRNQRDRMRAAIRTGLGKVPGSRMIALGTKPAGADHWFTGLLEGRAGYAQSHHTGPDDPLYTMRSIRRANPSWDHLPSLRAEILEEIEECKLDPAMVPAFKALRLNQGVEDFERQSLLEAGTWERAEIELAEIPPGRYVLGLDLAGGAAMSAGAAYWADTGILEAMAMFPGVPTLAERGLQDGVGNLYSKMAERGELVTVPGTWVPVFELLREAARRWGYPVAIAVDTWREDELRQSLADAQWPVVPIVFRRQGFGDGAIDVRSFREAMLAGQVHPKKSLLLRAGMMEAVTVADPARNEKLAKASEGGRRKRARDDAVAAAILAVAVGYRIARQPKRKPLRVLTAG